MQCLKRHGTGKLSVKDPLSKTLSRDGFVWQCSGSKPLICQNSATQNWCIWKHREFCRSVEPLYRRINPLFASFVIYSNCCVFGNEGEEIHLNCTFVSYESERKRNKCYGTDFVDHSCGVLLLYFWRWTSALCRHRQLTTLYSVKWYMKCFIYWTADLKSSKLWSSQLWTQFKQLRIEGWKSQDFNGVWTRDLAVPVRRSNQLSYEATDVGSWSFVSSKSGCEVIYEVFHILNCGFEIK